MTIYGELTYFEALGMRISSADVSKMPSLEKLSLSMNELTELDLSGNTNLTYLEVDENQLAELDLANSPKLRLLEASYNPIPELPQIHADAPLEVLSMSFAELRDVDVTPFAQLRELFFAGNTIRTIDLRSNKQLQLLSLSTNELSKIDLWANGELTTLIVDGNKLTQLDISPLTKLQSLFCEENELETLDLTHCPLLNDLSCNGNKLTALDFSKTPRLTELFCFQNDIKGDAIQQMIKTIPDISNQIPDGTGLSDTYGKLFIVDITTEGDRENEITKSQVRDLLLKGWYVLDYGTIEAYEGIEDKTPTPSRISMKTGIPTGGRLKLRISADGPVELQGLKGELVYDQWCAYEITGEDIVLEGNITRFDCSDNGSESIIGVTELDVSRCPGLVSLSAWGNNLTSLDLQANQKIRFVDVTLNQLTSLKLNHNELLEELICNSNQLTGLNAMGCDSLLYFECSNNGASFTTLNLSGCLLLQSLKCDQNGLTHLDVSSCSQLDELMCRKNKLTSLDLRSCALLSKLYCTRNNLEQIDLSTCESLVALDCGENNLSSLDLSGNPMLRELFCEKNKLQRLDLSQNADLKKAFCNWNKLSQLILGDNAQLSTLGCADNELTKIDLSGCTSLKSISCQRNKIKGEMMTDLIKSLPDRTKMEEHGSLVVVGDRPDQDGNVCTEDQVKQASTKAWDVLYQDANGERHPYEGSVGIERIADKPTYTLSPNPVEDMLYIRGAKPHTAVTLFAVDGSIIETRLTDAQGDATFDLSLQPTGQYILLMEQETSVILKK